MADSEGKKRVKKPNFTKEEIYTLVTAVGNRKKEIMSKFEGGLSKARQMQAWVSVQKEVMEISQIDRSIEELKKKWSDLKMDAKKKVRTYDVETKRTGGGDAPFRPEELYFNVIEIIGQESVDGVSGGVDSSARAGTSGAQQQAHPSQDSAGLPTPKKRRLDAQREHHGSERKEMIQIQRDILAAVSHLADSQKQLVDVAKRWLALEEYRVFGGCPNYQGGAPNM